MNLRRFDANTNAWTNLASMPNTGEGTNGVCYEGKIYATSGGGYYDFYIYDIATDSWTTGAGLPRTVECASMGAFNGKVFLIGGDDNFYPSDGVSDQVNIYDIATNTWEANGTPMPLGVSNQGFYQLGQYLYIVGGWSVNYPSNSNMTQRYDMELGIWETGATFTGAKADFPIAATSQYLYAMGGDQDGGGYWDSTNTVWRYDYNAWPAGAWEDTNDPLPFSIQAHFGGFTTDSITGGEVWSVGGLEGQSFTWHADNLYRAAEPPWSPTPVNVPWVWESPITGTVVPDGSQDVGVYLTAMSDTVPLPLGTYTATLRIINNDNVAGVQNVTVIMHIVEAYVKPEAAFTATTPVNVGEEMVFTNTTTPGVPPATTFEWDFGDGTVVVGDWGTISHTYATFGTFTVTLTACNAAGCNTFTMDVEVLPKVIFIPLLNKS